MRLLIISWTYPDEKRPHAMAFVHNRCKIYQRYGHKVLVFVPSEKERAYTYDGINVIKKPFAQLQIVAKNFDPDIVVIHAPSGWWLKYFPKSKSLKAWVKYLENLEYPIVTWLHGSETLIRAFHNFFPPFGIKNIANKIVSIPIDVIKCMLLRHLLSMSKAVVYVANWTKEMSQRYTRLKHPFTFVIPNPIDTELFKPQRIDPSNINKALAIRSMEWRYGLDIAIKAFAKLRSASLTILGRGSMMDFLYKLAKKCKAPVKFVTRYVKREDLPKFIASHGIFIAPSRQESQGVAMCEAMAVGLPVIATRVCGIPEFVRDNYNGILVPPDNPKAIRRAVLRLMADQSFYYELSKNAVEFVKRNLSQEVIYKKEYRVFKLAYSN